jgi:magnesium transporter
MAVGIALIVIILTSGLVGASVPLMLKKLDIDPALATGPFVTTSNDIISLFIYLTLVTLTLMA